MPDMMCWRETKSEDIKKEILGVAERHCKDDWIVAIDIPEMGWKMKL
jgi:hypothetical protein